MALTVPHLYQSVVSLADCQVQRGQQGLVKDVGVGPDVHECSAALCVVLLHCPVQGHVALLITAVQFWDSTNTLSQNAVKKKAD